MNKKLIGAAVGAAVFMMASLTSWGTTQEQMNGLHEITINGVQLHIPMKAVDFLQLGISEAPMYGGTEPTRFIPATIKTANADIEVTAVINAPKDAYGDTPIEECYLTGFMVENYGSGIEVPVFTTASGVSANILEDEITNILGGGEMAVYDHNAVMNGEYNCIYRGEHEYLSVSYNYKRSQYPYAVTLLVDAPETGAPSPYGVESEDGDIIYTAVPASADSLAAIVEGYRDQVSRDLTYAEYNYCDFDNDGTEELVIFNAKSKEKGGISVFKNTPSGVVYAGEIWDSPNVTPKFYTCPSGGVYMRIQHHDDILYYLVTAQGNTMRSHYLGHADWMDEEPDNKYLEAGYQELPMKMY